MLAVLLTLLLAQGVQQTLRLLLAGVVVGVVLGAVSSLILLLVPDIMQAMQSFMLGSTSFLAWPACMLMAGVLVLCGLLAWFMSPLLDALALGEATAQSLGLPLPALRMALVVVLALAYHHLCGRVLKDFVAQRNTRSHVWWRWFNELPVLMMVAAVVLVVVKPWQG